MNSIIRAIILSFISAGWGSAAFGYVCAAHLLVNKGLNQRIVLLSDYHEDTKASIPQRIAILDAAKKLDTYLVAEDNGYMCDYVSPEEVVAYPACFQAFLDALVADPVHFDPNGQYKGDLSILDPTADNESTPLLLATQMAKAQGIRTRTVECRQAEKISFRNGPITAAQVCQTYDALVARVACYNDGEQRNAFYKQKLAEYYARRNSCPGFFRYLESCSKNLRQAFNESVYQDEVWNAYKKVEFDNCVSEYIARGTDLAQAQKLAAKVPVQLEQGSNLYTSFFMYLYNFLIDAAIVHELATHNDEPVIFVYCGSWHTQSVLPALQTAGFELEHVWDARKCEEQGALDMERYFEQIDEQLQESIGAMKNSSKDFEYLDLVLDIENFDQGSLPFGLPLIIV